MVVYYLLLGVFVTLIVVKGVEFIVECLRKRRDAVRPEEWLVTIMDVLAERQGRQGLH